MAKQTTVESCLTWISDEKLVHERTDYGNNKQAVGEAITEQERRVGIINDYSREVARALSSAKDDDERQSVQRAYDELLELANRRLECLRTMAPVMSLEDAFGGLCAGMSDCAAAAAPGQKSDDSHDDKHALSPDTTTRAAQSCIMALQSNWQWMSKLVKCTDIHLQNAAEYHQFYHDVEEYGKWMPAELSKAEALLNIDDETRDEHQIHSDVKSALAIFLHWQYKLNQLFDRSKKLVPVPYRTNKIDHVRPVTALCNYSTKAINITEGEELSLMDNTYKQSWRVRNMHYTDADVPSVICLIPPPDPTAIQQAIRLRVILLETWTANLYSVGMLLILYLLNKIREWTPEEEKLIMALSDEEKTDVRLMLKSIRDNLEPFWCECPQYATLQSRMTKLNWLLDQEGDPKYREEAAKQGKALVIQSMQVDDLMQRYKEMWESWQTYKILVETSRHPELVLVSRDVTEYSDLSFIEFSELLRKWHLRMSGYQEVEVNDNVVKEDAVVAETAPSQQQEIVEEEVVEEEMIQVEYTDVVDTAPRDDTKEVTINKEEQLFEEAEEISTSVQEESRTFVITGVMDRRKDELISMDDAVRQGIIDQSTGTYKDTLSGARYPIPEAMNSGYIKVEFTTVKKGEEKRKDIGIITIKTLKESRPYTVKGVHDSKNDRRLSLEGALRSGILNLVEKTCQDTESGETLSLGDALDSGILLVEFDEDAGVFEPEAVTMTYAIHTVLDAKAKTKISFREAIRRGIIDQDQGNYINNVTGEEIFLGDAIKGGQIKATVVKDPSKLDIDPENRMVVDKFQSAAKKIGAVSAFSHGLAAQNGK